MEKIEYCKQGDPHCIYPKCRCNTKSENEFISESDKKKILEYSIIRDERWINVKDILPNDGDSIIFGANNICDMQERLCKPMVTAGWFMGGMFYSYLTKESLKANFWMPMPILTNGVQ